MSNQPTPVTFNRENFLAHNKNYSSKDWFEFIHATVHILETEKANFTPDLIAYLEAAVEVAGEQQLLCEAKEAEVSETQKVERADKAARRLASIIRQRGVRDEDDLCFKCGGIGAIPYYHHVDNGTCFSCNGTGLSAKGRKFLGYPTAREERIGGKSRR